tara:strand:+ start:661 stop:1266 length:606 start_codon:yes stop_codon:yes gene_type:complete
MGDDMTTKPLPDGFYYREINDAEISRPVMARGYGGVKIFYKLESFRSKSKWREDVEILSSIGWDSGNQFFSTHELLGELCAEKTAFSINDLTKSLESIERIMQEEYWACYWETNRRSNDFYKDNLVRRMLDKLRVKHISLEQGDMIQFQGMTFVLFDTALFDGKGTGLQNLVGYRTRWGQLVRTTDGIGNVTEVTLKLPSS